MTRPRRSYAYPDSTVESLDGRLRFSVETAEAGRPLWLPHRRVRRFRLLETGPGRPGDSGPYRTSLDETVVWQRTEKATHPWPWCLYVHDDGTTAVLHADDELRLYHPDGALAGTVPVLEILAADPTSRPFLARTTAGLQWDCYPKGCFFVEGGRLLFALRAFWGARVVVDARTGRQVTGRPGPALRAAEAAWALRRLERAAEAGLDLPFWTRFASQDVREVVAAVQLVGQDRVAAAAPLLLRLRQSEPGAADGTETDTGSPYRPQAGEIDIRSFASSKGRRAVQLALLRLGHEPEGAPAYRFFTGSAWQGRLHDPGPRPPGWQSELHRVRPGTRPRELLARVGAPFHVAADAWDYDAVDGGPHTVRVQWGREGVRRTQVIAPPEWLSGHARDSLD